MNRQFDPILTRSGSYFDVLLGYNLSGQIRRPSILSIYSARYLTLSIYTAMLHEQSLYTGNKMKSPKLTPRQIETLRHIHDLTSKRGMSPTILELRKAMGVASDQGVIEILQRLEDRGMIEKRTPGQARAMKLTAAAHLVIGAPATQLAGQSGLTAPGAPFQLNPHQQLIFKRLTQIDPKLARMYEGGLRVLLDETNPERIALSAHSIRESTYHLSNRGKQFLTKEEATIAGEQRGSNARQLEKLFDPLGGVPHLAGNLYDAWSRIHDYFVQVSHHRLEVTLDEYCGKLAEFEGFLSRYVLPLQTEIYTLLDEQLNAGPGGASIVDLQSLLSRNVESFRYFFRKADVRWLSFLDRHGLLPSTWEVADYLARVAAVASEDVMAIIERTGTNAEQWATRKGLIGASIPMPVEISRRLVDKISKEHWLEETHADLLAFSLNDLFDVFLAAGEHGQALRLSALLLQGKYGPGSHLNNYPLEQLLKRFTSIPVRELSPYIKALAQSLGKTLALERPGEQDDGALTWRPAVEDNDQNWQHGETKDHLVNTLRDVLSRYVEYLSDAKDLNVAAALDDLLKWEPQYSIFTRLKLDCYRHYPTLFAPEIERAIGEYFEPPSVWHEYFLLLKERFAHLKKGVRTHYLDLVDRGPKNDQDAAYSHHWKARRISPIVDQLSAADAKRFADVLDDARNLEKPDFLSHHSSGWVGPTSPISETDLAAMPISEAIDHLATWEPLKDRWFSSSREGLGQTLSTIVAKNAEAFSRDAQRFIDPRIRPVYVYHLFLGLREGLKAKARLDWPNIVALMSVLAGQAEAGTLPTFEADGRHYSWEVEWEGTFREIANLVEDGLRNNDGGPSFVCRDAIWKVIAFLCEHADPTPEYEKQYGGNNMEPVTLSLNTIRGRAFHALFAYIFWCDRHLGQEKASGSRIPHETKDVLESHLNTARDPSLAVRSVYGQFFPWLLVYDPPWAKTLIDRIFPAKDADLRYAAWETYLANGVFLSLYTALKPQYELAISEASRFKPTRRYWADPVERLAHHMVVAYLFRAEADKGAMWSKFFQKATPTQRGKAVTFAGRIYVLGNAARTGENAPDVSRLQQFWEWRLSETMDVEELREFGWWVKDAYFDDKWMLERLIQTLTKTRGAIAAEFYVLQTLATLAPAYPELCVRALDLIVTSRSMNRWAMADRPEIRRILNTACGETDVEREIAAHVIDHLTKLGFESYRSILETPPATAIIEKAVARADEG